MPGNTLRHLSLAVLLCVSGGAAVAQYVWQDEKGVRQYSDVPPPASVPQERILKSPGTMVRPVPTAAPPSAAPSSLAEREADFQKRRAEAAEKQQKDQEQARQDAERKRNCERLAQYGRALESGERIRGVTPSGERNYLSDEERERELRENRRAREHCI
ncbi:hypothetical protein GCM10007205_10120 [Oxalicibacterium flavum]|uniref:DUF4124 domain-containing protein n=1 Tax=Oxalicibacterium flavum TaxID=179467 RepID=A0A8J2UPH6_9BURK|nr:DUF4124 domain-containing protein [Oxalicibacterium flavum]GGC02910.1 hypothetical protein GCM10007205_10120 [Oxalicibacterium flavum]